MSLQPSSRSLYEKLARLIGGIGVRNGVILYETNLIQRHITARPRRGLQETELARPCQYELTFEFRSFLNSVPPKEVVEGKFLLLLVGSSDIQSKRTRSPNLFHLRNHFR
jgi:hypothetical protein